MKRLCWMLVFTVFCSGWVWAQATTYYVDASRADDSGSGLSWVDAKQTIQAAVDLAVDGDTVLVTNGVYGIGSRVAPEIEINGTTYTVATTNRLCITNAVTVRAVGGPAVTTIQGVGGTNGIAGGTILRGVYMSSGAELSGFSVIDGYAGRSTGEECLAGGGGILMLTNCVVTNCIIQNCGATNIGGGVSMQMGGRLYDCTISGCAAEYAGGSYKGSIRNSIISGNYSAKGAGGCYGTTLVDCQVSGNRGVWAGGCYQSSITECKVINNVGGNSGGCSYCELRDCLVADNTADTSMYGNGGGCFKSTLNNCVVSNNAAYSGAGVYQCKVNSSLIVRNQAGMGAAGGAYDSNLINCTVARNSARYGGGLHSCNATNCIVWYNTAAVDGADLYNRGAMAYSCSPELTNGVDNCITNAPDFVNAAAYDFHLQAGSPCINEGLNSAVVGTVDLEGNARIYDGTVDMGAYEAQPANIRPVIASLGAAPNPVSRGSNLTLTATGVVDSDGTVIRVEFYNDVNRDGAYDAGDNLLATDYVISGGTAQVVIATGSLPAGDLSFIALAYDNGGAVSLPASASCTIEQKFSLVYQVTPAGAGTINENPLAGNYNSGTEVNPSIATVAAGYRFDHWDVNGVRVAMPQLLDTNFVVTAVFSQPQTYYVDAARPDDAGNGLSWATAKQTIQAAVDLTLDGDTILVTNGVYALGGTAAAGSALLSRVCVTNRVAIRSVSGYAETVIVGAPGSNGSNDVDAVRGVLLDNGASLDGFTISNGFTTASATDADGSGGGLIAGSGCVVSNCLVVDCEAVRNGGGAWLDNSVVMDCCVLAGNIAHVFGGGAYGGQINNSLLVVNHAYADGGGVQYGTLKNCTLARNLAGRWGGGAASAALHNCIVWSNVAAAASQDIDAGTAEYTCASDGVIDGVNGCITDDPLFKDPAAHNYHLKSGSPCINSGANAMAALPTDLDGNQRIFRTTVDMGAYEWRPDHRAAVDFDGDGISDLAIFRLGRQLWVARRSSDGTVLKRKWGIAGDVPVAVDYDGDGQSDLAVFRPSNGWWYILRSSDAVVIRRKWGIARDVAVAADYDGDGKADLAIYRPATLKWIMQRSSDGVVVKRKWGIAGDIPVPADYDGDGKTDLAVFRPSNGWWYILRSSDAVVIRRKWGIAGDVAVPADYDGDGKADLAIFRPARQLWVILRSSDGTVLKRKFGILGDQPGSADYDGDGKSDLAVFRPSNGWWYILKSTDRTIVRRKWGIPGDQPVTRQHWIKKTMCCRQK